MTRSPRKEEEEEEEEISANGRKDKTSVGRSMRRHVLFRVRIRRSPQRRTEREGEGERGRFAPAFERRMRVQARTRAADGAPATAQKTSTDGDRSGGPARLTAFFTF